MRQIKFRAWDKNSNKMFAIKSIDMNVGYVNCGRGLPMQHSQCLSFEDIELMQYTGLKDKKGKEIYEKDILEADESHSSTKRVIRYIVIWTNMGYCCMPLIEFDTEFGNFQRIKINDIEKWIHNNVYEAYSECIDFLYYHIKDSAIVGNRFENFELLRLDD